MAQTSFSENMTATFSGVAKRIDACETLVNGESSASIAFGRAVKRHTTVGTARLPTSENDIVAGIVIHSHTYDVGGNGNLDSTGVEVGGAMSILTRGQIYVTVEDAVSVGDRLWVRAVAGGDPEFLGGLTNADDSTDTIDCRNQGVFLTAAGAGEIALLDVDFTARPGA